jgi:hypothetical protein
MEERKQRVAASPNLWFRGLEEKLATPASLEPAAYCKQNLSATTLRHNGSVMSKVIEFRHVEGNR